MKTNILLIGGYQKARALGESLIQKGYRVTIINKSKEDCEKLAEMDKFEVIWGDGSKNFIMEDANISKIDIVIAMTPRDEDNFVICKMCKKKYAVKKTVALISDPKKTDFFYKMGIDCVVCAINTITNIIEEQALMEKMTKMIPIENGRIHILEVPIPENSATTGKKLWEINLPKDVIIGCIIRGEESIIPKGDTRLLSNDMVIVITTKEDEEHAVKILTGGGHHESNFR